MDKIINVEDIFAYKEAVKRLKSWNINFDKKKLIQSPDLCREIIRLTDYYNKIEPQ